MPLVIATSKYSFAAVAAAVAAALASAFVASPSALAATAAPAHRAQPGVASSVFARKSPQKLRAIGARWTYDWSATPPAKRAPGLEWVPMLWGPGSVTTDTLATLTAERKAGRATNLLAFNEPDLAAQSNMTPARAAALWPRLQRTGLRLGSPAVATTASGWLERFMRLAKARNLRVDFIALHYYQDFTNPTAVADLRSQLIAVHEQYDRPIWVTEVGALDIRAWGIPMRAAPTRAAAVRYHRELARMLDTLPFVERYAWFIDTCAKPTDCPFSRLFTGSGALTPIGRSFRAAALAPAK